MATKILGAGAMGLLVAHELARLGKDPVLLFKSKQRLGLYLSAGSKITLVRPHNESVETTAQTIKGELAPLPSVNGPIENLVISTKSHSTVTALGPYIPFLNETLNVLILQNGMGMAEKLKSTFWAYSGNMPSIYEAISTHGAYKLTPNQVNHVGMGKLTIAPKFTKNSETPEMIQDLLKSSGLNASYVSLNAMLITQMEKLVVNACINPLTALLDCFNGDLLYGAQVIPMMKKVTKEAVQCFQAEFGAQIEDIDGARMRLDPDRLINTVLEVCKATSQNSSSMREDVRHMNKTEIDGINGYIVGLGKKHGIPTMTNKLLVLMVKNKVSIERGIEKSALDDI